MPYIGNTPAEKYASYDVQHITTSATTSYALDKNVANENEIRVVLNNIIQQPGASYAYTASANTLTLSVATTSSDTLYVVFTGKAVQTVTPPPSSVGLAQLNATGSPGTNTFLRGDNSWATPSDTSLTLNNNAANRVVAGTGTTNTMDAQAGLIFDGSKLGIGTSTMTRTLNVTDTTSGASTGIQLTGANNGTQFINFGDTDDSNVGEISYDHGTNKMLFRANDAYEMSIFNGVVGMGADAGTADQGSGLHIKVSDSGATAWTSANQLIVEKSGDSGITLLNSVSGESFLAYGDSDNNTAGMISYHHSYDRMDFWTAGSRRMRMNANKTIEIQGATGRASTLQIMDGTGTGYEALSVGTVNTGNATVIAFRNPNGTVGYINTNGTATAYLTSSDYRLKENVSYEFDATTRLKQLKPARFNFIADADTTVDGFIAHEVSSIVPEAISGEKDALEKYRNADETPEGKSVGDNKLDENGDTIIHAQSIDQSKLVPLLVKTIQELEARITALENA